MNMFDEARALRTMIKMRSLTQNEIAKQIGVSQSYVANKIRLLNFSDYIEMLILDANLSERHARVLLKLKDEEMIKRAIDKVKKMKLTVAQTDVLVDNMILDDMPKKLENFRGAESVFRFEQILKESIKALLATGIKVRQETDYSGNKKYITVCIEEK